MVLTPFVAGAGEDKFYTFNREEGNTCAGSLHGNFGNDGKRYHASFRERENGLYTPEIQSELQSVVYALRQDLLKDRGSMLAYCQAHPEAKLSEGKAGSRDEYGTYGFKLETDTRRYFINCYVQGKDSRFIIFAYADSPAPVLEQGSQPPQSHIYNRSISSVPGTSNVAVDKSSVLEEIRESRSASKLPAKSVPERTKAEQEKPVKPKKNQTEL